MTNDRFNVADFYALNAKAEQYAAWALSSPSIKGFKGFKVTPDQLSEYVVPSFKKGVREFRRNLDNGVSIKVLLIGNRKCVARVYDEAGQEVYSAISKVSLLSFKERKAAGL